MQSPLRCCARRAAMDPKEANAQAQAAATTDGCRRSGDDRGTGDHDDCPGTVESPEAELVAVARPKIDDLTAALGAADLEASEAALEAYDAAWNGIEVYVNVRSLSMYLKLEADLQVAIEDGLAADAPDFAALKASSEELAARYDDAIAASEQGPPLHPLFDDVATLRIIRADLRIATAALEDGNVEKAARALRHLQGRLREHGRADAGATRLRQRGRHGRGRRRCRRGLRQPRDHPPRT